MFSGPYYCDALDYNTGTWWICDDDNISELIGYPDSFYDELSLEDIRKKNKNIL